MKFREVGSFKCSAKRHVCKGADVSVLPKRLLGFLKSRGGKGGDLGDVRDGSLGGIFHCLTDWRDR